MKKMVKSGLLVLLLVLTFGVSGVYADANNHYVNGVEGLKGGSVPPPGFYFRMYNVFYTADELMDKDGNKLPINFEVDVLAAANRFLWVTNKKILGGDFFFDALVPVQKVDLKIGAMGLDTSDGGVGDIYVEPCGISWHGPRYDAAVGLSVYLPTGDFDINEPASIGKGFTTFMATFGGTYFFDDQRTLSASFLGRYEIHTEKDGVDLTPGNDFHFEWGIGKGFAKVWEAGIAGYCQWQVTDDSGSDATDKSVHDKVFAIGPEIALFIPSAKLFLNLRSLVEFGAEDRSEGNVTTLMLTKIF